MIYITGDVHGDVDFEKLIQLTKDHVSLNDTLIILGDAGITLLINSCYFNY